MTPDDQARWNAIASTFTSLDGWHARTEQQAEEPQAGSDLHEDDQVWLPSPISEMARLSLALSVEHLRLIRVVLEARHLFPSAPYTTLRAALVGAAQAVWVLGPSDRETRRKRGLTVIATEYEELAKFYREVEQDAPGTVPSSQWAWLNERISRLEVARGSAQKLNQTDIIKDALQFAFPSSPGKQEAGRLLWRQMSADAHVLGWAVSQRSHVLIGQRRRDGLALMAAPGSLEHLSDPFLCAYELARRGWSLFDQRCEAAT